METEKRTSLKKLLIGIGIIVLLCGASFCAGRFVRFRGASADSERLIEGIILSRDTANSILDRLGIAESALKSSAEYERVITEGLEQLQRTNEVGRLLTDEVVRTIEVNQRLTEELNRAHSELSDTTLDALELAARRAEEYERIIEAFERITADSYKDYPKSE